MTFLTPLAALVGLAAVLPLAAALLGRTRVEVVRRTLGLEAAPARAGLLRPALGAAGIVLLGLAAAQPVLEHRSSQRVRKDVQALFVLDTSRSMAASATPTSPTRLDRAIAAAVRLRSSIPEVPSGVATLTDRVLPDLLPVAAMDSFDAVARRAVAIESPPPQDSSVRATAYDKLAQIASGNYFDPAASRKIVVLLTDGESNAIDAGQIARDLPAAKGYRFVSVRFWGGGESVFDKGKPEADYRPDPSGGALLAGLAAATGGKALSESRLGGASSALVQDAGSGPKAVAAGTTQSRFALAPFLAAAAILLLLAAVLPLPLGSVAGGRVDQRV